jgi:hypothetical protein
VSWWNSHQAWHKKRWHTTARYFVLPFAGQDSQTPTDMSVTYSTLRYCKVMALQVGKACLY